MSHDKYFRELYKELYQKQKEEAELAKQVTEQSPISLISVSSKFFFWHVISDPFLRLNIFPPFTIQGSCCETRLQQARSGEKRRKKGKTVL